MQASVIAALNTAGVPGLGRPVSEVDTGAEGGDGGRKGVAVRGAGCYQAPMVKPQAGRRVSRS